MTSVSFSGVRTKFSVVFSRAGGPPILDEADMRAGLVAPYDAGASGVVIWGMPAGDMVESKLNATAYWEHVSAVTGPMAQAVGTSAERCAVEHCSDNGRCLALPNDTAGSSQFEAQCECEVPWGGASCAEHHCVQPGGVALASCFGWDAVDTTNALNLALSDPMVSTLIVDMPPDPVAGWTCRPIYITRSDLTVIFQDGVLVQAREGFFQMIDDSLLTLYNVSNVTLIGQGNATLRMRRSDYVNKSMGYVQHSEFHHGINLNHARDIGIHGLRIAESGGGNSPPAAVSYQPGTLAGAK